MTVYGRVLIVFIFAFSRSTWFLLILTKGKAWAS